MPRATFRPLSALIPILLLALLAISLQAAPLKPPAGWDDFQIGLVSDGKTLFNQRMKAALDDGICLGYRYAYINNGADPTKNAYSWLFAPWNDYVKTSDTLGLRPAFVIYMLQEDGSTAALARNAQDAGFMRNFFTTVRLVAEKAKGRKAIFVIEPDTWGYILQNKVDPLQAKALVNNLGADYSHLADLPNNYSGLARGIIRTVKHFAPDAFAGILMSHWTVNASECPGEDYPTSYLNVAWQSAEDVDCSADKNAAFANLLLGNGPDRGDFIGIEKNGHSAGYWKVAGGGDAALINRFYWNDAQNANFLRWCRRLGQGVNLPLLGWQISIGHMGLPNACSPGPLASGSGLGLETGNCAFEDTFFPYFFKNAKSYLDAGFIGLLAGKGLGDETDFTHADKDPGMGDRGWFFQQLKTFDQGRPYLQEGEAVRRGSAKAPPVTARGTTGATSRVIDAGGRRVDIPSSRLIFPNPK